MPLRNRPLAVRGRGSLEASPGPIRLRSSPRAGSLPDSLLPDATGEGVTEHELTVRDGRRRRRHLLGTLRRDLLVRDGLGELPDPEPTGIAGGAVGRQDVDRKSTRLNSSHANISYAVFCLKKKKP